MKYYITFGQVHVHSVNGKTFDKDCVAEIEADDRGAAHSKAMEIFKGVFHNTLDRVDMEKNLHFFPRGVIKLEESRP